MSVMLALVHNILDSTAYNTIRRYNTHVKDNINMNLIKSIVLVAILVAAHVVAIEPETRKLLLRKRVESAKKERELYGYGHKMFQPEWHGYRSSQSRVRE